MSESKKERVVVKKWDAVVFWKFGGKMDCAICRNDIMVPCKDAMLGRETMHNPYFEFL